MKKRFLLALSVAAAIGSWSWAASNIYTDLFTVNGTGALRNTAVAWVDSSRHLCLYDGNIRLDAKGAAPLTGTVYQALCVRVKNKAGTAIAQGDVLLADAVDGAAGAGCVTKANVTSTTTVLGVAVESIADGSTGFMAVSGYALVNTTGTVTIGQVLVSSAPFNSLGKGYAGGTATPTSGTDIGVALQTTAATDLILCKLR